MISARRARPEPAFSVLFVYFVVQTLKKRRQSMPKPEIEFIDYDTEYEWRPVEGDKLGIKEKILSLDPDTGDYTRMLKIT